MTLAIRMGLSLAVAGAIACSSAPPPTSEPSPLLKKILPSFQAPTANGGQLDTNAFRGRPLVVTFFSAECDECEGTLRATQETYARSRDVTVVGVYEGGSSRAARAFAEQYELRFPIAIDGDGGIAERFKIKARPMTFVVDRGGWVSWVGGADLTRDALASAVRAHR